MRNLKKGFTMMEMILVIIVIGILAVTALGSANRHLRDKTIDRMLTAFRYTQHLAQTDNRMNPRNVLWQRSLWTIGFKSCDNGLFYYIASDANYDGELTKDEAASSVMDNKLYFSTEGSCNDSDSSQDIFIGKNLSVNSVTFTGCNTESNSLSFDYLGRPYTDVLGEDDSNYDTLIDNDCIITISFDADIKNIILTINKETGFASVANRGGL